MNETGEGSQVLVPGQSEQTNVEPPKIEIAGKYASVDSLRNQASGNVPDVRGEQLQVATGRESNQQLEAQAEETKLLTVAEKQELLESLPEEVLEAKTPEEAEAAVTDEAVSQGMSKEEAKKRFDLLKQGMAVLGVSVGQVFVQGWKESSFGVFLHNLFGAGVGGRAGGEASFSGKERAGVRSISVGELEDKLNNLKDKPKELGKMFQTAYDKAEIGLKAKGIKLPEDKLHALANGDKLAIKPIFAEMVKHLSEGEASQKQKSWETIKTILAQELFQDKAAVFADDIWDFLKRVDKENQYPRYFGVN